MGAGAKLPRRKVPNPILYLWMATKILYCIWTIGVPLWLFLEIAWGFKEHEPSDQTYKDELAALKTLQDAARPVWAACALIMGAVLLRLH
jgi:hypothetical protein